MDERGNWSYRYPSRRPEVKVNHTPIPKERVPAKTVTYNKCHKSIDQGDTIAELRKAWGIPEPR